MNEEGFGRHLAGHETTFSQRSKVFIVTFPVLFSFHTLFMSTTDIIPAYARVLCCKMYLSFIGGYCCWKLKLQQRSVYLAPKNIFTVVF